MIRNVPHLWAIEPANEQCCSAEQETQTSHVRDPIEHGEVLPLQLDLRRFYLVSDPYLILLQIGHDSRYLGLAGEELNSVVEEVADS